VGLDACPSASDLGAVQRDALAGRSLRQCYLGLSGADHTAGSRAHLVADASADQDGDHWDDLMGRWVAGHDSQLGAAHDFLSATVGRVARQDEPSPRQVPQQQDAKTTAIPLADRAQADERLLASPLPGRADESVDPEVLWDDWAGSLAGLEPKKSVLVLAALAQEAVELSLERKAGRAEPQVSLLQELAARQARAPVLEPQTAEQSALARELEGARVARQQEAPPELALPAACAQPWRLLP